MLVEIISIIINKITEEATTKIEVGIKVKTTTAKQVISKQECQSHSQENKESTNSTIMTNHNKVLSSIAKIDVVTDLD